MGVVKVMALANLFNFFMPVSIMATCDFYQEMIMGKEYYIYNVEYPNTYKAGTTCRWVAQSQMNTKIVLTCEDIDIPGTTNCYQDRLAVSLTGNVNLEDAHNYCGKGRLSLVSSRNSLTIGLYASSTSKGGRFLCTVAAIANETPTTDPPVNCDCGWKQQRRIVGGQETKVNEFPAMAALVDFAITDVFCGATIIADHYAITAAHCCTGRTPSNTGLLVGDHNISTGSDTNAAALYVLDVIMVHEKFDSDTYKNDIAIVKTQNVIVYSERVGPICLPFRYSLQDFNEEWVTALGWGTLEFSGPKSDTLQAVNLTILANSNCRNRVSGSLLSSQVCTYTEGKDACQYDSGGPLFWTDRTIQRLHLVGIISFGSACASTVPAVNTRVTSFLTWIVSSTNDTSYCIK